MSAEITATSPEQEAYMALLDAFVRLSAVSARDDRESAALAEAQRFVSSASVILLDIFPYLSRC